ncbi:hypothetical protein GGTG_10096 [Gaeumannomyces tritici R3-111a-1]|uniref:Uncharacterized protein n=1 Tax=Gaeumannomyces tritici (strain R3-111a-1) TaxID=644352 RepID=J3P9B3_GAET3|nr:hypothetical protein GGTG_10096 [Gaeumannomyces tritici R3-111a-1]EJT73249.1 hypothetical protein GGTG_10096 [Gaeumannomyces tritici R3-111a-1]
MRAKFGVRLDSRADYKTHGWWRLNVCRRGKEPLGPDSVASSWDRADWLDARLGPSHHGNRQLGGQKSRALGTVCGVATGRQASVAPWQTDTAQSIHSWRERLEAR